MKLYFLTANVFGIGSRNHTKSQEEVLLQEIFGNNRDFHSLVPKYQLYSNDPLVILFNVTIFHVYYIVSFLFSFHVEKFLNT